MSLAIGAVYLLGLFLLGGLLYAEDREDPELVGSLSILLLILWPLTLAVALIGGAALATGRKLKSFPPCSDSSCPTEPS